MTPEQRVLSLLVGLGLAAAILRLVSRRVPVPFPVLLAVVGVAGGSVPGFPSHLLSPAALLLTFVPGLVFEAAINLDLTQLRKLLLPVSLLATVGVGVTLAAVAGVAHLAMGFPWLEGALLGAILAPTDPIAVVAVLRGTHTPPRVIALLEGESLLNDGTAIAAFATVSAALASGGQPSPPDIGINLLLITFGGVGVGLAAGLIGALLLRSTRDSSTELLITLLIAYGSYLAADLGHVSGVVATVTAGLVVAGIARRTAIHAPEVQNVWSLLGFVLNAVLFLAVGSAVPAHAMVDVALPAIAVLLVVLAVRTIGVSALLSLSPRGSNAIAGRWRGLAIVGGMRGALSVALALVVTGRTDLDPRLAPVACGVALLSLIAQGATTPIFMRARDVAHHGGREPSATGTATPRHRSRGRPR